LITGISGFVGVLYSQNAHWSRGKSLWDFKTKGRWRCAEQPEKAWHSPRGSPPGGGSWKYIQPRERAFCQPPGSASASRRLRSMTWCFAETKIENLGFNAKCSIKDVVNDQLNHYLSEKERKG